MSGGTYAALGSPGRKAGVVAVIGKTVIRPGGRASTRALLARAGITAASKVLDVGCRVATTAVEIASRYGAQVTAIDIAPLMLEGPKPTSAPPG